MPFCAWGSRHADRLRPHHVPFIEAQGAIVDAAWQAETIFSERNLSPMVTARHSTDLRNALMALVNKEHRVFGKIFDQGGRRLTWQAASSEDRRVGKAFVRTCSSRCFPFLYQK